MKVGSRNNYIPFVLIILIGLFILGLFMAGVVIFLDFYGFIPKSGEIYSISIGIQSYGGLAKNVTLILPVIVCDSEVLKPSNVEIVKINDKLYYKIQIENLSYKYVLFRMSKQKET